VGQLLTAAVLSSVLAHKILLQVSICIHKHMDNKLNIMVGHDSRGKSIFSEENRWKISIHM